MLRTILAFLISPAGPAAGALIGLMGYTLFLLPVAISTGAIEHWQSIFQMLTNHVEPMLLAPLFGLLAGSVFWFIAVRRSQ
jgi:hypothetical protein